MTLKKQMKRHLGKRTTQRIYSAMPWVGGILALAAGTMIQKRGLRSGLEYVRDVPSSMAGNAKRVPSTPTREDDLVGSR